VLGLKMSKLEVFRNESPGLSGPGIPYEAS
jgi:hypothetical protein